MSQPTPTGNAGTAPRFYVTPRQRLSPGILALALLAALVFFVPMLYALRHSRHAPFATNSPTFGNGSSSNAHDDDDDPSQVDTIYLGGPDQAPTTTRPTGRPSTVHPFVVVQLPRSGEQTGQIPDSPAGHLLYNWLAAFNGPDPSAFHTALPTAEPDAAAAAQTELRQETGGFTLLSAKEIQPGLLVFRLQDQTPAANEGLGTLQVRPGTHPAAIASFSLRGVGPTTGKVP